MLIRNRARLSSRQITPVGWAILGYTPDIIALLGVALAVVCTSKTHSVADGITGVVFFASIWSIWRLICLMMDDRHV
jgi:hypothetical protein